MRMAHRLLKASKQSPIALAHNTLSSFSSGSSSQIHSSIPLLHNSSSFVIPLTPGVPSGQPKRKWVQNAADCLWLVDGVYSSCVALCGCSCVNSCILAGHDICVYQLNKDVACIEVPTSLLPSFHATLKYNWCCAPLEKEVAKCKFCSVVSWLRAYYMIGKHYFSAPACLSKSI